MRLATSSWGEEGRPLAVLIHGVTGSSRTWWRVWPWFAQNGWRVVALDLRGHGASPRATEGLTLDDLAGDVYETVLGLLGPDERIDVLLGHSLEALTALKLYQEHGDRIHRLVLEEPPGSENTDFDEIAQDLKAGAARAREAPEALVREQLEENPSWSEEDSAASVAGLRACDAGPAVAMLRDSLRYDLSDLVGSSEVPVLLILRTEELGSALPEPERTSVVNALRRGAAEVFEAGHGVHRDDFERYVTLLERWLETPGS